MVNEFDKAAEIIIIIEKQVIQVHEEGGNGIPEVQGIEDANSETEEAEFFEQQHDNYVKEFSKNMNTIYLQRCDAHTLQLAATDAMKDSEIKPILKSTRKVAKACYAPIAVEFSNETF